MFEDVFDIVETPCLLVDRKIMEENLKSMQAIADASGVALRPHVKTHKIPEYARLQVELGAKGITCAKVSEAEVMADGGLDDIFLAYPQVGKSRIERVVALAKRIKRLVVGVDSIATATMLSD
jgi:D-serine deaminase-like pyridoxal phosphate-dependent protein